MVKAFLIGAGATKAEYDNAPVSQTFFKQLREVNESLYSNISTHLRNSFNLTESNIEDIMEYVDTLEPSRQHAFDYDIHKAIFEVLAESTESTESSMSKALQGGTDLTTFKNLIIDDRLLPEDFFITLNYDLYLDREILSRFKSINYGNPGGEFISDGKLRLNLNPVYSVYHLHGALNWERLNEDNRIKAYLGAISPDWRDIGSSVCIVPPGRKKLYESLRNIWKEAYNRLMNADELIIIGCSLNAKDVDLINMVKLFYAKKTTKWIKIIYLDDQYNTWLKKDYELTIGKEIKTYKFGFTNNPKNARTGVIEFIFEK